MIISGKKKKKKNCSLLCTNCSLLCTNCSLLCTNCSLLHGNMTWQPIIKIIAKISFTFPRCSARYCVQARCHGDIATGLGLQIMPAPVGQGYSLRSTQDILVEKGSKHRMNGGTEKRKSGAEKRKSGAEKRKSCTEKRKKRGAERRKKGVHKREIVL